MNDRVLFVDDDPQILSALKRNLRGKFTIETASDGYEAVDKLSNGSVFAVVVADMQMPGMNGVELLKQARELCPDTVRMMLTGNADQQTAVDSVNEGQVFSFMCKPCEPETIGAMVARGIEQHRLMVAEKELLEETLRSSLRVLTEILGLKAPSAFGFGEKLVEVAKAIAGRCEAIAEWEAELSAMLSQVGFIVVPERVIDRYNKGERLTPQEQEVIDRVPETGYGLVKEIPRLETVARSILYQNKYSDGTGFPATGLKADKLPMCARLLRVAKDLLQYERAGLSRQQALQSMHAESGKYDAVCLEAAIAAFDNHSVVGDESMREVFPVDLKPGDIAARDVLSDDGVMILPEGTRLSPMVLHRLRNFAQLGVFSGPVYIQKHEAVAAVEKA